MTALPLNLAEYDPESRIIDACRNGDANAYSQLVETHWDRIYLRVLRFVGNHEDAEEVTQDAFLRAYRNLEHFRGQSSFSTWLFQIATNLAHNRYWYWKRRGRGRSVSFDQHLSADESGGTLLDVIPGNQNTPAEDVDRAEFFTAVDRAIPALPAMHREILQLRLHEDLAYEEIATRLDLSIGTVKSRIARAREHLREAVGA